MRVRSIKFWQDRIELEDTENFPAERRKLPRNEEQYNYLIADYFVQRSNSEIKSQIKSVA